jgi:hypothetical protein
MFRPKRLSSAWTRMKGNVYLLFLIFFNLIMAFWAQTLQQIQIKYKQIILE